MKKLKELKEPIGKFILNNGICAKTDLGAYYHYTEVIRLIRLYNAQEQDKPEEPLEMD